ncbi:MAG: hypothetical protein DSZ35_10490 [Verrucomicrobia bacterium]|nr:MAG: hypothetical protein DSZ35_10490 [Verrucomicrobiota bacterium]
MTGSVKVTLTWPRSEASPGGGSTVATFGGTLSTDTAVRRASNNASGLVRRWLSTITAIVFSPSTKISPRFFSA